MIKKIQGDLKVFKKLIYKIILIIDIFVCALLTVSRQLVDILEFQELFYFKETTIDSA